MYEPAGRAVARSSIVVHNRSSQAKPCGLRSDGLAVGVEATARPAVAGGSDGVDGDQDSVAVAVDRDVDEAQHVAAGLALPPEPVARPRVEVHVPGGHGRRERLAIHVRDHQDAAVMDILDDGSHEAVRAVRDVQALRLVVMPPAQGRGGPEDPRPPSRL